MDQVFLPILRLSQCKSGYRLCDVCLIYYVLHALVRGGKSINKWTLRVACSKHTCRNMITLHFKSFSLIDNTYLFNCNVVHRPFEYPWFVSSSCPERECCIVANILFIIYRVFLGLNLNHLMWNCSIFLFDDTFSPTPQQYLWFSTILYLHT